MGLLALIYIIEYFVTWGRYSLITFPFMLLETAIIVLSAFLIRFGYMWVKWMWLFIAVVGTPFSVSNLFVGFSQHIFHILIIVAQVIIQALAVVFMFLPQKKAIEVIEHDA